MKRSIDERLKDPHDDLPSMQELEDDFARNMFIGLLKGAAFLTLIVIIALLVK